MQYTKVKFIYFIYFFTSNINLFHLVWKYKTDFCSHTNQRITFQKNILVKLHSSGAFNTNSDL